MVIYVVVSNYFNSGLFGSYSTMKRARKVIETFLTEDENVESIEELDDYVYKFTTKKGETFSMEILWDVVDAEYEEGLIKEDE